MLEVIKLKQIKVGTVISPWICEDASHYYENPEDVQVLIEGRETKKGDYRKCVNCAYRFKPQCQKIACMSFERKDNKSVLMERL